MNEIPGIFPCQLTDSVLLAGRKLGLVVGMIQMEMEFALEIDAQRLARAMDLLLDLHPILTCRIDSYSRKLYWERIEQKTEKNFIQVRAKKEYDKFKISSLDPYTGPVINLCLWKKPQGISLILKVSHEISDAGGVKEIAMDLASIYTRLEKDPEYQPMPDFNGSRGLWQVLRYLPFYKYPEFILQFLHDLWSSFVPINSHTLPLPIEPAAPMTFVIRHLSPERVSGLAEYGRSRNATLNDIMVTGFYRALAKQGSRDKIAQLRLQTTVDLRRYLPTGRAQAICNLSAMAYPYLGTYLGNTFDETLERVVSITRKLKANWIGMPMLLSVLTIFSMVPQKLLVKLLGSAMMQGISQGKANFPPTFTNMGPIRPESLDFGGFTPMKAWLLPPLTCPPVFFTGLSGYSGSLTLSSGTPQSSRPIVEKFFDEILTQLPV
jgi:NRPS condensation-like uncharacterized protein